MSGYAGAHSPPASHHGEAGSPYEGSPPLAQRQQRWRSSSPLLYSGDENEIYAEECFSDNGEAASPGATAGRCHCRRVVTYCLALLDISAALLTSCHIATPTPPDALTNGTAPGECHATMAAGESYGGPKKERGGRGVRRTPFQQFSPGAYFCSAIPVMASS